MAIQHKYIHVDAEDVDSEITTQEGNDYELKAMVGDGGNLGLLFVKGGSTTVPTTSDSNYDHFRDDSITNSATEVKASEGNVYGIDLVNPNSSVVYVKLYNDEATNVTVGETEPVETIQIDSESSVYVPINGIEELHFDTALSVAATTEAADSGSTAPTDDIIVQLKIL